MLILTRKRGSTIIIGDDIRITIVDVSGDQIKLGIDAPRDIPVHREEVYDRIQAGEKKGDNRRCSKVNLTQQVSTGGPSSPSGFHQR